MFCLVQPEVVHQVSFVTSLSLRSSPCWHPLSLVQHAMNDAFQPVAFSFISTSPVLCISTCLSALRTCRYWSCIYLVCHVTNIELLCLSLTLIFLLVFSDFFSQLLIYGSKYPSCTQWRRNNGVVFISGGDGICGTGTKAWFLFWPVHNPLNTIEVASTVHCLQEKLDGTTGLVSPAPTSMLSWGLVCSPCLENRCSLPCC